MTKNGKQQPKYQTIKDYVTSRIVTGEYGPNTRIPSENEFTQMLDVSSITIRKALSELVNEGLIYRVKGKGSFVSDNQRKQAAGTNDLAAFLITTVNIHDASFMKVIMGMQKKLSEAGFSLIVENLMNYENNEQIVIDRLIENRVAGFIVYPDLPSNPGYLKYLGGLNVPCVLIDRYPKGQPVNFVGCNNRDSAITGARHLISIGHEKIGFLAYSIHISSEKERYEGFMEAMQNAGLEVDRNLLFLEENVDWNLIADHVRSGRMTAICCVNDLRALQLIDNLTPMGVRIPEDLSVMGFDDAEYARHAKVQLSTMRQPFHDIGYTAAQMLLDIIQNPQMQYKHILLGAQLVIRNSTQRLGARA